MAEEAGLASEERSTVGAAEGTSSGGVGLLGDAAKAAGASQDPGKGTRWPRPDDFPEDPEGHRLLVAELAQAVLRKVEFEGRLKTVAKGVQRNGKHLLVDLQRWQREMHAAASQDLQRQEDALRGLQAENTQLKDTIRSLADWLVMMGFPIPQAELAPGMWTPPPSVAVANRASAHATSPPVPGRKSAASPGPAPTAPGTSALPAQLQSSKVDGHPVVVTLRRADGIALGLRVASEWEEKALRVEGIEPGGAAEAWNRLCDPARAIRQGDVLVAVNGAMMDALGMLQECQSQSLLRIVIARGQDGPLPTTTPTGTTRRPRAAKTLDADAPEFTPTLTPPRRVLGERQCRVNPGYSDARAKPQLPRLEENILAERENDIFEDLPGTGAENLARKGSAKGWPDKGSGGGARSAVYSGLGAACEENKEN